jgi:signal peptidase I
MNQSENVTATLACDLAGEVVRTFGEIRLRVFGTSMVPSILPGDLISVQRVEVSKISVGDIVLYSRAGRMFVHRVVARCDGACVPEDRAFLLTRGDRLGYNDPEVSPTELLGRVVSISRNGQKVVPSSHVTRSKDALVRLLQASDYATYLYLRVAPIWRTLFPRRVQCQA